MPPKDIFDELETMRKENDALSSALMAMQRRAAEERKARIRAESALSWYIAHNVVFYR